MLDAKERDKKLIDKVIKRDVCCLKCGTTKSLQAHHVIAFADGGEDSESNMETLCIACHKEWHRYEEIIPYSEFKGMPRIVVLLKIFSDEEMDDVTVSEIRCRWMEHVLDAMCEAKGTINPLNRSRGL